MKTLLNKTQRIVQGSPSQRSYEQIIDEAATLRMQKVLTYGEHRYDDPSQEHAFALLYADIYRKFIRIQNFLFGPRKGNPGVEGLRDTLIDMLNYCAMGVQLLDKFTPEVGEPVQYTFFEEGVGSSSAAQLDTTWTGLPPEEIFPSSIFGPIEQIAFVVKNSEQADELQRILSNYFGAQEWVRDVVDAEGYVFGQDPKAIHSNRADLRFNYQGVKGGLEFEIIHYLQGPNYLQGQSEGLAHMAVHVTDMDAAITHLKDKGFNLLQDVRTVYHSNENVPDYRRYHYTIYDTRKVLGFRLKLIERLTVAVG